VLGLEGRYRAADPAASVAWVEHVLPLVRSDLMGIQIINEPAYWFTPQEYAAHHRQIASIVRALAPGVPIVAGDSGAQEKGQNSLAFWEAAVAAGATDYDVLSLHVTGTRREGELKEFAGRLRAFCRPGKRLWITEGDWGHLPFLRGQGLSIEETFIYTWNDDADPALIRRPGGRLP
jgi:hypothetical protein